MASTTTRLPWIQSPNENHGNPGLDPSSLDSLTFSQILLPVVCAVFISLVIVIIACCLIQRKPKSAGKWRKKSCHTIETSHDTSDVGVYDVIDERSVSTCTPEKTTRQSTKLDSNYILGSHLLGHSKSHDLLPPAIIPVSIPVHAAPDVPVVPLKLTTRPRRNLHSPDQAPAILQKPPDCLEEVVQDEGIYESLDRHSTVRNTGDEHTQYPSIDRSLSFYHRDMNHISRSTLQSNNTYETLNWRRESKTSCDLCNYQDLRTVTPAFQATDSNKIVCQLSMFKVGDTQEKTTLIDKAYYRVQSQTIPCLCASSPDISTIFHNRSLRLVHHRLPEKSPDCGNGHDLILKPVSDAGGYVNNLKDSNTFANSLQKILMTQQTPLTADSQRNPEFPKQYENFTASHSDLCVSVTPERCFQHNGGCNISTPVKCSDIYNKYSDFATSPEATRISAKLGPLPPLPVQYNVLNEMRKSHSSLQQSNDIKFDCSQTKCTASRTAQQLKHIHRNQHTSTSSCRPLETAHDKRSRTSILNQEVDLLTCRVHSLNTECHSEFRNQNSDISFVTNTRHVDDNTKVDCFNENSNVYFILEPTSDVSSLNSDTEDTAERQPMRNQQFR